MSREATPDEGVRGEAQGRPRPRPIAEIKRDLDAVVEEYGALLNRLKHDAEASSPRAHSA